MQSKTISIIIVFTAVAIILNAVRIPTIYWSLNFYQFSQIPIVAAFLLFGVRTGILVGILNWLGALILFPLGLNGVVAYSMDFISLMVMFMGLYSAKKIFSYKDSNEKKIPLSLTSVTIFFRASIMPLVDYGVLYHILLPLFFGLTFTEVVLIGLIPIFIVYNVTTVLYTVPVAYIITVKVGKALNIYPSFLTQTST